MKYSTQTIVNYINLLLSLQGWQIDDNPVSTVFEILWMIFEPILFGITGAVVKVREILRIDAEKTLTFNFCIQDQRIGSTRSISWHWYNKRWRHNSYFINDHYCRW